MATTSDRPPATTPTCSTHPDSRGCANHACDGVLVEACRADDPTAWQTLVHRHGPRLQAIARGICRDGATAEDVVQAAWSDLFRHLDQLRDPHAVAGWLATTTRRRAINASMAQRRATTFHEQVDVDTFAPDEPLLRTERNAAVRDAFAKLPTCDQQLLGLLFSSEKLSYEAIACTMGRSIGSIGPTRARALARLRHLLKTQPGFDANEKATAA